MKSEALRLTEPGELDIVEIDVPDPGPGEVMIEVKANGICKGDVAIFTGELNYGYPFFHGHEPVGVIAKTGAGITEFEPGDKVACLSGPSYRKHVVDSVGRVAKIPDQSADLALWITEPPSCAVNGVQCSELRIGDKVALIGCGYMGNLVLQAMPRETFSRLVVIDPDESRLAAARALGVGETYRPDETDLQALAGEIGGFDVVVEASGVKGTISTATEMARVGGVLNIFGWHAGEEVIPTHDWHYKGLRVLNTAPMIVADFTVPFRAAVALMGIGRIDQSQLITHRFPMAEAARAFEVAANRSDGYLKGVILF
jgi:2-desacetyl-2-hydroxyethyl bacteriochlorophyllide A dehydrogenase